MRTTITIDDELFASAAEASGEQKASKIVAAGLRAVVAQESAKRLRALGGKAPDFFVPARSERLQVAELDNAYPESEA